MFSHKLDSISRQQNAKMINDIIGKAVLKTIRDNVGLDKIFKRFNGSAPAREKRIDIKNFF